MKTLSQTRVASLLFAGLVAIAPISYGQGVPQATVSFNQTGFTVSAPAGAALLEVRLMGPARTLLLDARTAGAPIEWTLSGSEAAGEYRYEAVVVMDIDGTARQRTLPGGFEVNGGVVIAPPLPEAEARFRGGVDRP